MTKTALVAGGGIAGTVAAIALQQAGWQPQIFEARAEEADERAAFLTVAVNGMAALRALGLDPAKVGAAGFPTPQISLGNGAGRRFATLPLGGPTDDGTVTTTIKRTDLYAALREEAVSRGIPIEYGKRVDDIKETSDGVALRFADGSAAQGELLVGADGVHSRTRKVLNPGGPALRHLGLLNAAGFTTREVKADLDRTPGLMHMAFGRRCFFGWAIAPDGSVWWFANPPAKRPVRSGDYTPETWRAHVTGLFADDAIPATAIIEATDEVIGPWNTYDLPSVPVWHSRRIVLVGDAAHAASPTSGQGASMAIEDAVTLGRCLESGVDLAAYEQRRRARVEKVIADGRRSGSGKAAGPIGAVIRDAMVPLIMRLAYRKGNPQAWILDYRV